MKPKSAVKRYFETDDPSTSKEPDSLEMEPPKRTFPKKSAPKEDPFPGEAPVDPQAVEKYVYADEMPLKEIKTKFSKKKLEVRREKFHNTATKAAKNEILLYEDVGFLEPDEGQYSYQISQKEIVQSVDISSATKHFDLHLPKFGPYQIDYTRNGRHLLIGGKRGHVAAFDWLTKHLHCETNVMEGVRDVKWLHLETMYAIAQKRWTYIYDNQGVELHCLKQLFDVRRLEFLPYHFLLVASTDTSYLHWLDVSIGKLIQSFPTRQGRLNVICQNPANAIIHCGHAKGTVTQWSPNVKEPLVKMLCHPAPVKGVSVDNTGNYMATTGMDRKLRIWDLRQYKQLYQYKLPIGLGTVKFSQRRCLAAAVGTTVQIFKDVCRSEQVSPYLTHDCHATVTDLKFSPFEDVLGVGHQNGFTSLLVPGSGEPNIDALEANPYQSKTQRKEQEVKGLLDKIQPDMITLDSGEIAEMDTGTLEDKLEEKAKKLYLKPQKVIFKPKHKMKGKGSSRKKAQRKKGIEELSRVEQVKERIETEKELFNKGVKKDEPSTSVLDRFKRKDI